jgi:GT2 family glycosyltransferase
MTEPLVSIQLVVRNGTRYLRHCLDAVKAQTYPNLEVIILDNASDDGTASIVESEYPEFRLIRHDRNLGTWPGQEYVLAQSSGTYIVALSVDVIMSPDFVRDAVRHCEQDPSIAGLQGKVYQYSSTDWKFETRTIDTCGFTLTRARRVVNIGHGAPDGPDYSRMCDIFGVEGAVPFFRRSVLEDCRIDGALIDPDYFWYGDDLDLVWRMTLLGHRQVFAPDVVAWHDRSTTKGAAATPVIGQLSRLAVRQAIPLRKRRLDWSNVRFTIIKNDYILNILRDLPYILAREIATLGYTILFEPAVLLEARRFLRLVPVMFRRRKRIMARARTSAVRIHSYFT